MFFDHAAGSPLRPEVARTMIEVLEHQVPNPSGAHRAARASASLLESAREVVAGQLGVSPRQIVFTSGGTEACGLAFGVQPSHGPIALSTIEHVAIAAPARRRSAEGAELRWLDVDAQGVLDVEAAVGRIASGSVVAVMAANNETGAIQPIAELRAGLQDRGSEVTLICDAIAAAPTEDLRSIVAAADLVAIAGHKLGGPAGAGVLVVGPSVALDAVLVGGAQEGERRAGTQNVAAAVGLAVALELASQDRATGRVAALRERRDLMQRSILDRLSTATVTSSTTPRLPGHLHLTIEGLKSEELLFALDQRGVAASAGAACASGAPQASHVLVAMGMDPGVARGALRLTLSTSTSDADARRAADLVVEAADSLRG